MCVRTIQIPVRDILLYIHKPNREAVPAPEHWENLDGPAHSLIVLKGSGLNDANGSFCRRSGSHRQGFGWLQLAGESQLYSGYMLSN